MAFLCAMTISGSITANAHGGRTDGSGGHKDNKNASGLGSYHYHCGGNPAHLHTNGCPYKATAATQKPVTSNSNTKNNNSSSNNNSSNNKAQVEAQKKAEEKRKQDEQKKLEAQKKANEEKLKKEKEEIDKKGYELGLKDGYAKKTNESDSYSGNSKEDYVDGYNRGYIEGKEKIDNEINLASKQGHDDGIKGIKNNNKSTNKLIGDAYNNAYVKAINEYNDKLTEEYKLKGEEAAKNKKEADNFGDSIDEKYKNVYLAAYKEKKTQIEEEEQETSHTIMLGAGALALIGGGTVLYKKKNKRKIDI